MSTDENNNEKEPSTQGEEIKQPESNPAPAAAPEANAAGSLLSSVLALKDSNPKVFFGGLGAVVLVVLILLFSGSGSDGKMPVHQAKAVVIGQNYVLKSANAYDQHATIRLVAVPGSMAAYDDTEENDREGGCKHIADGTPVKVIQSQDAYGKKDVVVESEMQSGDCEGNRGWAVAINLQ